MQIPNVVFSPPKKKKKKKKKPNVGWQIIFFFHPNSVKNSISVKNTKKKKNTNTNTNKREANESCNFSSKVLLYVKKYKKVNDKSIYPFFNFNSPTKNAGAAVLQLLGNLNIIEVMYDVPS